MTAFFHDVERDILIYPTQSSYLKDAIPEAREINGQYMAIPRNLRNSQILRYYQYPVPPIMDDYDWPIQRGRKPLPHQVAMANFSVLHRRMFNLSDMGTMKTMATLWAAEYLMLQHPPGDFRVLIVGPLSVLQRVWGDAIRASFLGRRTCAILHGTADRRLESLARPADFYIINFDGVGVGAHTRKKFELDGFSKALALRQDIQLVIVDEASGYKDATTLRHRIARTVIGKRPYLWLLTGTPTPNAPTDAYGLAKLSNNAYGKSFRTFQDETMLKRGPFKWTQRADGYEKAHAILQPSIRYDIKDVWNGPEITTQQREVELTASQKEMMKALKKDLQIIVQSGKPITAANEAAARTKYMQISLGAIYDENHKVHKADASPRIAELRTLIDAAPAKILVFVPLTSVVNLVYKHLAEWERESVAKGHPGRYTAAIVNGDTSQKQRSQTFENFQNEVLPRILVADPGTMAHGLDLWQAQTVIWYGICEKTEIYLQANKRAHRPGQQYPVTVVQIVSNPLEREIFRRLENNESLQGTLLDMVRQGAI